MHSNEYYYFVGRIVHEKAPRTSASTLLKTQGDYYNITTIVYRKVHCHTCDESVDVKFTCFRDVALIYTVTTHLYKSTFNGQTYYIIEHIFTLNPWPSG